MVDFGYNSNLKRKITIVFSIDSYSTSMADVLFSYEARTPYNKITTVFLDLTPIIRLYSIIDVSLACLGRLSWYSTLPFSSGLVS